MSDTLEKELDGAAALLEGLKEQFVKAVNENLELRKECQRLTDLVEDLKKGRDVE